MLNSIVVDIVWNYTSLKYDDDICRLAHSLRMQQRWVVLIDEMSLYVSQGVLVRVSRR